MNIEYSQFLIVFMIITIILILLLSVFLASLFYKFQKRQNLHIIEMEEIKIAHENTLLQSQLEMQEQTFQHIAREIHDNIGQKLTYSKLQLNTIDLTDLPETAEKLESTINMLTETISDLSDLSRSMSSDLIIANGLLPGISGEIEQLKKLDIFDVDYAVTGETAYLNAQQDLLLFRIIQESVNNIIKHAQASAIKIHLHFTEHRLQLMISDNGRGFIKPGPPTRGNGLHNIKKRADALGATLNIESVYQQGTTLTLNIPLYATNEIPRNSSR